MTNTPPTLRDLLAIPVYRKYFQTIPRLTSITASEPWQVWIATPEYRWKGAKYHTYRDGYNVIAKALKARDSNGKHKYVDAVIVSRVQMYAPPTSLTPVLSLLTSEHNRLAEYVSEELHWCGRCRRPSSFAWSGRSHHALRSQPALSQDEPYRCFYCGIRRAGMPRYQYRSPATSSLATSAA